MRTRYFSSVLFALLASFAVAANSAPAAKVQAEVPVAAAQVSTATSSAQVGKVNLNTADVSTLQQELFGVGAVKAQAIVAYRESNGPFASVDELLEVKGIGKSILERNRDKLEVN